MRWFTLDWWCGDDESDPWPSYEEHVRTLRPCLPAQLVELLERVPLHDAHLREVKLADSDVVLLLDVLTASASRSRTEVRYRGAQLLMTSDPARGLGGPHGFGDLGYDEIDVASDGRWLHRLLFSSGIELEITFRDAAVSR